MIQITDKSKCCGCTACYSICPKNCISMEFDSEGFLYPVADKNICIDCHVCEKVCPFYTQKGVRNSDSFYGAIQHKDTKKRMSSTAGGMFSLVADHLIDRGAVVFAVGYDENVVVCHIKATDKNELEDLRGSKYVQSHIGDTYRQVKDILKTGKQVLFVGTPCQIHGLINYVGYNENLYTIDLLCLGVSSPKLFADYIDYLNKKYNNNVTKVQFRNKYFGYATPNVRVCFKDGKFIQQKYDSKVHANLFFKKYYNTRPSCYMCQFREIPRVSDFTIGDFTEIGKYSKDMDDDKGTTRFWAHTKKAADLLKSMNNQSVLYTLDRSAPNIVGGPMQQIKMPSRREEFFKDAAEMDYRSLIAKYEPKNIKGEIAGIARQIINRLPFKSFIFKKLRAMKAKKYHNRVRELNK